MSTLYIAFDPGLDGGICIAHHSAPVVNVFTLFPMPTLNTGDGAKRVLDLAHIFAVVKSSARDVERAVIVIEKQQPFPKQGGVSNFTTGRGFGSLEMLAPALGLPCHQVHPKTWQKIAYEGVPGEGKERSIIACSRIFPEVRLLPPDAGPRKTKLHDGMADALLIAYYAARSGL